MRHPELRGEGLVLRRLRMSEARELALAVQESLPELRPYMPWAHEHYGLEDARAFIRFAREQEEQNAGLQYGIFRSRGDAYLGQLGIDLRPAIQSAELGYWVRSRAAGRGVITRASSLLMAYAFEAFALRRMALTCDVKNRASRRVAEKLGMRREGRIKAYLLDPAGRQRDHYLFGILKEESLEA